MVTPTERANDLIEDMGNIICNNFPADLPKQISLYLIEQLIEEKHYDNLTRKSYLLKVKEEIEKL